MYQYFENPSVMDQVIRVVPFKYAKNLNAHAHEVEISDLLHSTLGE